MDEIIGTKEAERLAQIIDEEKHPNTFNYLLLHGLEAAVPSFNLTAKYNTKEKVYAECLKMGITWERLLKPIDEDCLY